MRLVKLGSVLRLTRTKVQPSPSESYRFLGVRSFGKGMIEYEPTLGSELSKVGYYKIPGYALVVSNIKAWEGGVAVSSPEHEDFVSSQRLLPYVPISEDEIDVRYAYHYLLSDEGLRALGRASPGSADRNRTLGRAAFDGIELPLPRIEVQREIAHRLDAAARASSLMDRQAVEAGELTTMLTSRLYSPTWKTKRLGSFLRETSDFRAVDPGTSYELGGIKWYAEGVFAREAKPGREIKGAQLSKLAPNQFIYNRLFAWKGSFAITSDRDLYVSKEFPTFEIDEGQVHPEFLLGWYSLPAVWDEILRLSTGATTGSRNRLKQQQLLAMEMPVPDMPQQLEVVRIIRNTKRMRDLNRRRSSIANALPQAARNAEYSALIREVS